LNGQEAVSLLSVCRVRNAETRSREALIDAIGRATDAQVDFDSSSAYLSTWRSLAGALRHTVEKVGDKLIVSTNRYPKPRSGVLGKRSVAKTGIKAVFQLPDKLR
jgi:hypothetical protein